MAVLNRGEKGRRWEGHRFWTVHCSQPLKLHDQLCVCTVALLCLKDIEPVFQNLQSYFLSILVDS